MIALIQRVLNASVTIDGEVCGEIGPGLLVLLGVEQGDDEQKARRLCERVIGYRIFGDENDKMNLNVQQAGGSLLVVSQFTLAADTSKGMRPGFLAAQSRRKPTAYISISAGSAVKKASRPKPGALLRT